jgi:hypothetical protein
MEKSRSNGTISVKALSKVLERSFAKTQSKRAYKIRANKTRFMEETLGGFAKKPFGNTKSVVEYLGRYIKAISNHRIKASTLKM